MPQLVTHNIFAKDVFSSLDNKIKSNVDIPVYEMFSQSFDNFLYYISLNFKKYNSVKKLTKKGHKTNVKKYFMHILKNIMDLHLENDPQVLAYLYGSINHYVLDSTCHPFIFYKTGVYDKKKKETKKYRGLHGDMESNIDAFFYINKYHKLYYKVNITKEFIPKITFSKNLENIVNASIYDTFKLDKMAKCYFSGYKNSRILYRLFINDKYGIKKLMYKILDKVLLIRPTNFEYYSTYIKQPNINYLNIAHKKWYYPSDESISSNESFIDLYNKALQKSLMLILLAHEVLHKQKELKDFENKIENLSYVRGLDCDRSHYMTKFEF